MTQLMIHIGPFKTGTTSFQDYMWHHRESFLKEGILYPQTGIHSKNFGARHLMLARGPKKKVDKLYTELRAEIAAIPDLKTVVLSSERYSQKMKPLIERRAFYEDYNPKLVIAVRDEVSLVRSMYFQIIKSRFRFMKPQQSKNMDDFPTWFEGYKHKLCYPVILEEWINAFGGDSVIYVPYEAHRKISIINSLSSAMGLPEMDPLTSASYQNPSIGGLAAAAALHAAKSGPAEAKRFMEFASELEEQNPEFKKINPLGFDAEAMSAYYAEQNAPAFKLYPAFQKAHEAATSRD